MHPVCCDRLSMAIPDEYYFSTGCRSVRNRNLAALPRAGVRLQRLLVGHPDRAIGVRPCITNEVCTPPGCCHARLWSCHRAAGNASAAGSAPTCSLSVSLHGHGRAWSDSASPAHEASALQRSLQPRGAIRGRLRAVLRILREFRNCGPCTSFLSHFSTRLDLQALASIGRLTTLTELRIASCNKLTANGTPHLAGLTRLQVTPPRFDRQPSLCAACRAGLCDAMAAAWSIVLPWWQVCSLFVLPSMRTGHLLRYPSATDVGT